MSAWAESTVKRRGEEGAKRIDYPPIEGEPCGKCQRELRQGERVFRLCGTDELRVTPQQGDDPWVCESCLSKGDFARASQPVDEWPYPDEDPPDPL